MEFDDVLDSLGGEPWFDMAALRQLCGGEDATARTQVSRWIRSGRLIPLRRGMYTFGDRYRKAHVAAPALANALYRPSYLSGLWLLSFVGVIPEMVTVYTSVSTRAPKAFDNAFGRFRYRHVKRELFFGFLSREIDGAPALLAEPEKALLDLFHLEPGEWSVDRLRAMRVQRPELVRTETLRQYGERMGGARIARAVLAWDALAAERKAER